LRHTGPALLASLVIILMPALVSAQPCPGGRLLLLTNGKIHTMDAKRTVVSKVHPWLHVYYMVTGKNVRGEVINDGQQITRQEAVWLYTGANGWFSREEDTLGTIEAGRLADLVVLNVDVFDPKAVPDESIRRVHSVLTILGGRVVYGDLKRQR
jgi:Amidohydrolase family